MSCVDFARRLCTGERNNPGEKPTFPEFFHATGTRFARQRSSRRDTLQKRNTRVPVPMNVPSPVTRCARAIASARRAGPACVGWTRAADDSSVTLPVSTVGEKRGRFSPSVHEDRCCRLARRERALFFARENRIRQPISPPHEFVLAGVLPEYRTPIHPTSESASAKQARGKAAS